MTNTTWTNNRHSMTDTTWTDDRYSIHGLLEDINNNIIYDIYGHPIFIDGIGIFQNNIKSIWKDR